MGMFHNLMTKIFAHAPGATTPPAATTTPAPGGATPAAPATPEGQPAAAAAVDIAAVMEGLAAHSPEALDWKRSIVDLLKLVGMDSSLAARRELAEDLHYPGDQGDSAAMNQWLHKEVLAKLAANGGKVPAELLG